MKKALLIIIVLICIAIIAVAAVFFIRQHHASSDTSEPETSDGSGSDPASTAAKEALEEMIEGLPAPASIDPSDASEASEVYEKISEIYEFIEEHSIDLTEEQERFVREVIDVYNDRISGMELITSSGGILTTGEYTLYSDVQLIGADLTVPAGEKVVIDLNGHTLTGTGDGSVITVEENGELTLTDSSFFPSIRSGIITGGTGIPAEHLTLNGVGEEFNVGGGIYVEGSLIMDSGVIYNCSANAGGGVYVRGGSFLMTGGTIDSCSATGTVSVFGGGVQISGGGIFRMEGGSITNCTVTHQATSDDIHSFGGGGVSNFDGEFIMSGGVISGCYSDYNGGGLYVMDSSKRTELSGGTIENCSAAVDGGGIFIMNDDQVTLSGSVIRYCSATDGGAVYVHGPKAGLLLKGGELIGSSSADSPTGSSDAVNGGAMFINGGSVVMTGGAIHGFAVSDSGGAVYIGRIGSLSVTTVTISDCFAAKCGGGIYSSDGNVTLGSESLINNCIAGGATVRAGGPIWDGGGGVFIASDASLTLNGGKITGCSTTAFGGGVFCYGNFDFISGDITDCSAFGGGGILIADGSHTKMSGGSVTGCTATSGNGGGVSFTAGEMILNGAPVIDGNVKITSSGSEANNLYIADDLFITLGGALTQGARIGISVIPFEGGSLRISGKEKNTAFYASAAKYFSTDADGTVIRANADDKCLEIGY